MSMGNIISSNYTVSQLVKMFRLGEIGIPEIQRDVVWDSDDIKKLIDSINRGFPCGSLILWEPRERDKSLVRAMIRPERHAYFKNKTPQYFLLDGQQRLSALASVMLERPLLRELLAELNEEMPSLYANLKKFPGEIEATAFGIGYNSPNWVLLNDLFNSTYRTSNELFANLSKEQQLAIDVYVQRIRDYQFPIQIISGRKYSDVAEIFTRVNSQGTSLTGAEIHLATIVPKWPGITSKFRDYRRELHDRNYDLDLSFLMRVITVIECGVAQIKKLAERIHDGKLSKPYLNRVWGQAKGATNKVINKLNHDLSLDKTKFFPSKNVLIPLVCYVVKDKGHSPATSNMMRFFLYSQLSERYGGGAESVLKRDVRYFNSGEWTTPRRALNELVNDVRREAKQQYKGMKIKPNQISGPPSKNVMLLLMYILMQRRQARDFGTGKKPTLSYIEPENLHIHHIFPFNYMMQDKTALHFRDEIYGTPAQYRADVNDIANMTFLSQNTNAAIGDEPPFEYLPQFTDKALRKAHFIPEDKRLWYPSKFDDFLRARRRMISMAANSLLKYL
jgi:hypothetical protein